MAVTFRHRRQAIKTTFMVLHYPTGTEMSTHTVTHKATVPSVPEDSGSGDVVLYILIGASGVLLLGLFYWFLFCKKDKSGIGAGMDPAVVTPMSPATQTDGMTDYSVDEYKGVADSPFAGKKMSKGSIVRKKGKKSSVGGRKSKMSVGGRKSKMSVGGRKSKMSVGGRKSKMSVGGRKSKKMSRTSIGGKKGKKSIVGGRKSRSSVGGRKSKLSIGGRKSKL